MEEFYMRPVKTKNALKTKKLIRRKIMEEFCMRPVKKAFENAWKQQHFSKNSPWTYIYSDPEFRVDYFKHSLTRKYQQVPY